MKATPRAVRTEERSDDGSVSERWLYGLPYSLTGYTTSGRMTTRP